jgi:hypothetical protein
VVHDPAQAKGVRRLTRIAAGTAAILVAGCGGGGEGADEAAGPVKWAGTPKLLAQPSLPGDRILGGKIRNDSRERITLQSKDVRVVGGRDGGGRFVETFVHGNIPVELQPGPEQPLPSRTRLGYTVTLDPGEVAPLVVTYRVERGTRARAVTLRPGVRLSIPDRTPDPVPEG